MRQRPPANGSRGELPLTLTTFSLACGLLGPGCAENPTQPEIASSIIASGHSHNDYRREEPLWEALESGFPSVEVDVHRVGPLLLVGHDGGSLRLERTLQSLYLDPLQDLVGNRGGRVFHDERPLVLLIDVKTDAMSTYALLREVLAGYGDILTEHRSNHVLPKAVSVVISGNCPRDALLAEEVRYCSYDGRPQDLAVAWPNGFATFISVDWQEQFGWTGDGPISASDRAQLHSLLDRTHQRGAALRFWNLPEPTLDSLESVWDLLLSSGVDVISVDDLERYRRFAESRTSP